jgi:hypothetical protein
MHLPNGPLGDLELESAGKPICRLLVRGTMGKMGDMQRFSVSQVRSELPFSPTLFHLQLAPSGQSPEDTTPLLI